MDVRASSADFEVIRHEMDRRRRVKHQQLPPDCHCDVPAVFLDRFEEEKSTLDESESWDEDDADGDDPWDLQAGHGTHVAGMICWN
jgi:hypothetical protein